MARDENMPFPLGQTYFGGDTYEIDVNAGTNLEGQEYSIEDDNLSNGTIGANVNRSGRRRKVRIVRNVSAVALLAGQIAKMDLGGALQGNTVGQTAGLVASAADKGFPVDEFLGPNGCLVNDMCYVVIDGLATVKTDSAGTTTLIVGQIAVPGATTAGTVVAQDTTTTGAALFNQIQNAIGRCVTAVAANSTSFVVDVGATHR